jgi:hypothetical protein
MLRALTLTAVTALGLLATVPAVEAHPPVVIDFHGPRHHHHRIEVLYRRCGCPTWECYGSYRCFEDAEHAAHHLRRRGFEVRIRG